MVKKSQKSNENSVQIPIEKSIPETENFDSKKVKFNDIQPTGVNESMEDLSESNNVKPKRRGRPSKAEKENETQEQVLKITEDIFTPVFNLINRVLVNRYSPVVKLNEDEITSMKFYLALVANKYLPSAIQKYGAEVTLSILTFTIVADKTIKYQEWKSLQKEKEDYLKNEQPRHVKESEK